MVRMVSYGNPSWNTSGTSFHEVRDAIIHEKKDKIQDFVKTSIDHINTVIDSGVDPTYLALNFPEFIPRIIERISQDPHSQVPEVIINIAKSPHIDTFMLLNLQDAFLKSCDKFSYQMILEGIDIFDNSTLLRHIEKNFISKGNCKSLSEFVAYCTSIEAESFIEPFIKMGDLNGILKLEEHNRVQTEYIEEFIFNILEKEFPAGVKIGYNWDGEADNGFVQISGNAMVIKLDDQEEEKKDDPYDYVDMMIKLASQRPDRVNLDRFENFIIDKDLPRGVCFDYIRNLPNRDKIRAWVGVHEVMES